MARIAVVAGVLAGLVLGVFLTALTRTPAVPGDATGWLQADSLFRDRDLSFGPEDFERFSQRWPDASSRVALYRSATGELRFDRPFLHAALASPFALLGPRGPVLLNALLLALVAWLAAWVFGARYGWSGYLLVTVFLFGSSAFFHAFQTTPATLLLLSGAGAFALIFGPSYVPFSVDGDETPRFAVLTEAVRFVLAGLLLGIAIAHHPFYLLLLVAAGLAAGRRQRALALPALGAGAVAIVLLATAVQRDGAAWLGTPAPRALVSVQSPDSVEPADLSAPSRAGLAGLELRQDPALAGWNVVYALAGRHVGILLYFLPVVLALVAGDGAGGRRPVLLLSILTTLLFVLLHPFDFAGGFAHPRFLPVYGALWYVVSRPSMLGWLPFVAVATVPALYPSWSSPTPPSQLEDGSYRQVAPLVRRFVPLETTQRALFPGPSKLYGGLWVKQLSGAPPWSGEPMLVGTGSGEILIASPDRLPGLQLSFPGLNSDRIEISGGRPGTVSYRPGGGVIFGVEVKNEYLHHSMWWGPATYHLYAITARLPDAEPGPHPFALEVTP